MTERSHAAAIAAYRRRMKELGDMTQQELSIKSGLGMSTLTQILNDHRDSFSDRTFSKLSKALGWEPDAARALWNGAAEPGEVRILISAADGLDLDALPLSELLDLNEKMQAALRRKIEEQGGSR